jgi:hypothetical protein
MEAADGCRQDAAGEDDDGQQQDHDDDHDQHDQDQPDGPVSAQIAVGNQENAGHHKQPPMLELDA